MIIEYRTYIIVTWSCIKNPHYYTCTVLRLPVTRIHRQRIILCTFIMYYIAGTYAYNPAFIIHNIPNHSVRLNELWVDRVTIYFHIRI